MGRRVVGWLAFGTAVVAVVIQVARGPVGGGYGWDWVAIGAVLSAAPLVLLGLAVRSGGAQYAWMTLALAALVAVFVMLALVGNWTGQSSVANAVDAAVAALVLVTCVGAWIEEVPLLAHRTR